MHSKRKQGAYNRALIRSQCLLFHREHRICGGSDIKYWKECDLKGTVYCQAISTLLYHFKTYCAPSKGEGGY